MVHKEFSDWVQFLGTLKGCSIEYPWRGNDERAMIASREPVPWHDKLYPQYNEAANKIGYLHKQKRGIRLDIDFLPGVVGREEVLLLMKDHQDIKQIGDEEKAPTAKSYWKYKIGSDFNTFTLCIRNAELQQINLQSEQWQNFFQKIVDGVFNIEGASGV